MTPPTRGALRQRVAVLWLVISLGPLLLYFLARSYVDSDVVALAISAVVPAVVTVVAAAWRRQARLLSALAVVGVGVALAATAMTGGSSLPLKLYRPLVTSVVGLVVLLSALLRRPLLVPVLDRLAGRVPMVRLSRRTATVVTVIIGVSFLGEALATVSLALTMSTAAFLIASRLVRITVFVAGAAVTVWYLRRQAGRPTGATAENAPAGTRSRTWFGPRRVGLGWGRPQTWQARVTVATVLALIVIARVVFHFPGR
jgi:hypothetical protein